MKDVLAQGAPDLSSLERRYLELDGARIHWVSLGRR
jgi:hypothetical protein